MITVFGMATSGNCWKVAQILRLRGLAFDWVETDSNAGATRTDAFLRLNPNGKVPVVQLDDGACLTESNAIMAHFAEGTPWLPEPGLARTRVFEWLFFEQYSHEPFIAVARTLITLRQERHLHRERLEQCRVGGERALDIMARALDSRPWLTESGPTIADLALFAYTHVADEGDFDLARWPAVAAWVTRLRALSDALILLASRSETGAGSSPSRARHRPSDPTPDASLDDPGPCVTVGARGRIGLRSRKRGSTRAAT
jgi:glutathione S-transferase